MAKSLAVILAGGDPKEKLRQDAGLSSKALLEIQGKPLVGYVLTAFQQAGFESILIGDDHPKLKDLYLQRYDPQASYLENLRQGLEMAIALGAEKIFISTCDLFWLKAEDILALQKAAQAYPQAGFIYPIMTRQMVEKTFPEQKRSYAKLKEGEFTGASVVVVDKNIIPQLLNRAEQAYQSRKSLIAFAMLLGFKISLNFLLKRLSISQVEGRIGTLLRAEVKALLVDRPALAIDVDELEHLNAAQN
ncbi:MAG: NTP transferase domain-containing protein [Deinococcales bacterium]